MILDFKGLSELVHDLLRRLLRGLAEQLVDVSSGSGENLEFDSVDHEGKLRHFLQEPLQVEPSLVDELDVFVADGLLGRQQRDWDAWPFGLESLVKLEEFVESSLAFPDARGVRALAGVSDVTILVLRVDALELLLDGLLHQLVVLVEHVGVDHGFLSFALTQVLELVVPLDLRCFLFFDVRHIFILIIEKTL